jgi:monoamine oxidase
MQNTELNVKKVIDSNQNYKLIPCSRRKFLKLGLLTSSTLALAACGGSSSSNINPQPTTLNPASANISPGSVLTNDRQLQKVLIIGAGAAGLVAAYELTLAGHDVTILEARERSGGRIHTLLTPFNNQQFAEAGASRIPSNHNVTLAYAAHFGLTLDTFYPASADYININNGVTERIPSAQYIAQPPFPTSLNRSEYRKIRGGMFQLPQAFSNSLSDKIFYDSAVNSVFQDGDKVVVNTENGQQHNADRILCTVPLPVLNKIEFSPALSEQKMLAASGGYQYTASSRFFTQFSQRFWLNDGLNAWGDSDLPEEIWQPTWDDNASTGIIQSYLRGAVATQFDGLSHSQQVESVHNRWQTAFPDLRQHIATTHVHSWAAETWSGSAYASPSPAEELALGSHISMAEDRVHFAGEHASEFHGWIQGALESGLRAATEIHQL